MTAARSFSALTCTNILDNGHPAGNAPDGPAIGAEGHHGTEQGVDLVALSDGYRPAASASRPG